MTIQDIYDAIPNPEDVDAIKVNTLFSLLKKEKEASKMAENEPMYLTELSREKHERTIKNPFWDSYLKLIASTNQLMGELNITPRSRKTLMDKTSKIPKLG